MCRFSSTFPPTKIHNRVRLIFFPTNTRDEWYNTRLAFGALFSSRQSFKLATTIIIIDYYYYCLPPVVPQKRNISGLANHTNWLLGTGENRLSYEYTSWYNYIQIVSFLCSQDLIFPRALCPFHWQGSTNGTDYNKLSPVTDWRPSFCSVFVSLALSSLLIHSCFHSQSSLFWYSIRTANDNTWGVL